jgi:PAS domain S-box-containing protein
VSDGRPRPTTDPMSPDPNRNGAQLQKALRDLIALSAVPSLWVGREPRAIAADLVDLLVALLNLDFAFVRLSDSDGSDAVEIERGTAPPALLERLRYYLDGRGRLSHPEVVRGDGVPGGGGIVLPLGLSAERLQNCLDTDGRAAQPELALTLGPNAEVGMVAVASARANFPNDSDQLLLSIAACHGATAFGMARIVEQHRRAETALAASERQLRQARDELETKVAERTAELRRSEAYLAEAERLSHTGTWALDWRAERTIVYWSEESYWIYGLDPRQGLPTRERVWQQVHPDDRNRAYKEVHEALRERRDWTVEFRIRLPDGTIRHLEEIGHHTFSAGGDPLEVLGVTVDVTERKRALDERERLSQLESELAHLNRLSMMGVLAASLAHEVKQPIAAARNNARAALNFLAMKPPDLGEVTEALGCIVSDADRAGEIIDRIRAQVKKAPPRSDRFDLNDAVTEVVELARSAISKHEVALQMRLAQGLVTVQGDRVQLQQVILNLVLNAIEAMSPLQDGPRELLISTGRSRTNTVVSVHDSGPGIVLEQREHVFEAFYTTKANGVGIGLSICRSIIDAHGGRLWIEANEPRGAVFQFTVPSTASELRYSPVSRSLARGPHADSVPDAARRAVSEDNKQPRRVALRTRRPRPDRTS